MVLFKGFEITVQVNGQSLEELGADLDDAVKGNTITRYIEAKTGARFSICGEYVDKEKLPGGKRLKGLSYHVYVDGIYAGGHVYDIFPYSLNFSKAYKWKDNKRYSGDLLFSELQIEDTEHTASGYGRARDAEDKMRKAGVIEVEILRFKGTQTMSTAKDEALRPIVEKTETVPEKALKGDSKSHYTQFGPWVSDPATQMHCDYIDLYERPYVTFRFEYRSRKSLEAQYIIRPPPTLEERDEEELTPAELKELVVRYKKREAEQASRIKKEHLSRQTIGAKRRRGSDGDSDNDTIVEMGEQLAKRGGSSIPILPGGTVDLTVDWVVG